MNHVTTTKISVAITGEVVLHRPVFERAGGLVDELGETSYDFTPMFGAVKTVLTEVDFSLASLPSPVGAARGPFASYPRFVSPPAIISNLRDVGFVACSLASNHSLDDGLLGVRRTQKACKDAGLVAIGTRSAWHQPDFTLLTINNITLGLIAGTFGVNRGTEVPSSARLVDDIEPDRLLTAARRARIAGAEIVVASLHWGFEYQSQPTSQQVMIAEALASSHLVDVIAGHHAHVVQPFDVLGTTAVAYGLGNLLSNQAPPECPPSCQDGAIIILTFRRGLKDRWHLEGYKIIPTFVERPNYIIRTLSAALLTSDPLSSSARRTMSIMYAGGPREPLEAPTP